MTHLLADRINKIAPGAKVISFDVFDTLVKRPVEPHLTIEATTRFVCRRLGLTPNGADFDMVLEARQESWKPAFSRRAQAGLAAEDATIAEMFPLWLERLETSGLEVRKNKLTVRELIEFELGLEQTILEPIYDSLASIKLLKAQGAKLFFISDMYLSRKQVANLLDDAGYAGLFDGGFVSGEVGFLKRTGTLFSHVMGQGLSIDLHVGDSHIADFQQPSSAGIAALHWESPEMLASRARAAKITRAVKRSRALVPYALNDLVLEILEREGVTPGLFALIYANFGFVMLQEAIREPGPILLPAREGLVLFAALEATRQHSFVPPFKYVPISRNAVSPILQSDSPVAFFQLLAKNAPKTSLLAALRRVGYSDAEVRQVGSDWGFSNITGPMDFYVDEFAFIRLLRDPLFKKRWAELCSRREHELRVLLQSEGFTDAKNYFVDLGWNGSIQANIDAVLQDHETLEGLYFGLTVPAQRLTYSKSVYRALVASQSRDLFAHAGFRSPQALEMPMLAPHDSVAAIPSDLADTSWAQPSDRELGVSAKAAIQADTVAVIPLLTKLHWLFDVHLDDFSALTRVMTAVQLWLPSKSAVDTLDELTTDAGLGESKSYGIISPKAGIRAGYTDSLWREGWAARHLPRWLAITLLSVSISQWKFGHFPDTGSALTPEELRQDDSSRQEPSGRTAKNTRALPLKNSSPLSSTDGEILHHYQSWLLRRGDWSGDSLTVGKIIRLRIILVFANIARATSRRPRFEDWSIPSRDLVLNSRAFKVLL
jgi:FMN phosphatase YigB (HAD superfamily)